jgi:hypothetical protein
MKNDVSMIPALVVKNAKSQGNLPICVSASSIATAKLMESTKAAKDATFMQFAFTPR